MLTLGRQQNSIQSKSLSIKSQSTSALFFPSGDIYTSLAGAIPVTLLTTTVSLPKEDKFQKLKVTKMNIFLKKISNRKLLSFKLLAEDLRQASDKSLSYTNPTC